MLFMNINKITCIAAVTAAIIEYAFEMWSISEDDITRDADKAWQHADWQSAACAALGVNGTSSSAIFDDPRYRNPMVELCETMTAIVGLRVEANPLADTYGLDASVNAAVLGLAS